MEVRRQAMVVAVIGVVVNRGMSHFFFYLFVAYNTYISKNP